MQKEANKVYKEILEKITVTREDRVKIMALARELKQKVALACEEHTIKAIVRIEGSVAKDTWLKKKPEIDIFMRLPTAIPRRSLGQITLKIARKATEGSQQIERFAEHPYLEAFVGDVRVNIVPCYDVKRGEWLSATDRTPFHTDYIKRHLNKILRNEVRLLKKFLQGITVYGAEIRTGGFSGYLCELLILNYKSFSETLRAFAKYMKRIIIDIEGYYAGREKELQLLFPEPLVVVDPVDERRNVASAVQPQKLYTFIGAARAFLKTPNAKFFYPPEAKVLSAAALRSKLENRGASLLFLRLGKIAAVPDVLWGQLYKTQRSLRKLVELNDFKVLRDAVWSDEKTVSIFVLELEQHVLSSVKKHLGPPLERKKECENFLSKYANSADVVSGPYIEDGRWVVELRRKVTNAVEFLKEKLSDGGRNVGVAELVSRVFKEKFSILVKSEVVEVCGGNREFAVFLTDFLSGKPFWLETAETEC
ncbi:MAG: CCA tRNA nucleotidyltransferase [Candidatus Bathyarchaeota archaeon]|nr:MAG: CCA tRNA nucleotidyltransferase [Candidatus Bathyarchaeota archaeon]